MAVRVIESTRALAACSLLLAVALSGCGKQTVAQDEETGSDTGSLPGDCPKVGLSLSEEYSGAAVSAVMLPADTNHVTSSCGGDGVDQAYLVTSQKTANYNLWVSPEDLESPLTVHIHAGDSCDGPELYCATGTDHHFPIMLAEGETVTVVVDTEPDLTIPADGLRYDVTITWGPEPGPCEAEAEAMQACNVAASEALAACMASDSCTPLDQATMCNAEFSAAMQACVDTFCPSQVWTDPNACTEPCDAARSSCGAADLCDTNTCTYHWQMCMDACTLCTRAEFEFEYAGECELALPGPPSEWHAKFMWVEIDGDQQPMAEPGIACDDPSGPLVVWASDSVLQLCTPACDAFAAAGAATVVNGSPPCE